MLEGSISYRRYFSCLAFVLGCSIACCTYLACSERAVERLVALFIQWYQARGAFGCFTVDLFAAFCVLFLSASALGYLLIPVCDGLMGVFLTFESLAFLQADLPLMTRLFLVVPAFLSAVFLLRISALCAAVSQRMARLWQSNGARSFDLQPISRSIWLALLLLVMLLPVRCFLLLYQIIP